LTTTVNTKGQVTIPGPLRRKYGFPPGTKVVWIERDGELIPRPILPLADLYGYFRPDPGEPSLTEMLIEERRLERDSEDGHPLRPR
jgi:AbrB family looped-hinge helix DNA binding protein